VLPLWALKPCVDCRQQFDFKALLMQVQGWLSSLCRGVGAAAWGAVSQADTAALALARRVLLPLPAADPQVPARPVIALCRRCGTSAIGQLRASIMPAKCMNLLVSCNTAASWQHCPGGVPAQKSSDLCCTHLPFSQVQLKNRQGACSSGWRGRLGCCRPCTRGAGGGAAYCRDGGGGGGAAPGRHAGATRSQPGAASLEFRVLAPCTWRRTPAVPLPPPHAGAGQFWSDCSF
jgi:hypothetical protein